MKNLLIILLLFAGINCQAQTDDAFKKYTDAVTEQFNFVFKELKQRTLLIGVLSDRSSAQGAKIRMLEDRISELEKKVDEHLQDSIIKISPVSKWETNNKTSDLVHQSMARGIAVTELLDYQKECYNDSTSIYYDWYNWDGELYKRSQSIDPGMLAGYVGSWKIYEHKDPSFEGFIEYMKRQMK